MARSASSHPRARGGRRQRPVVSLTSILIFSGFLAGIASARVLSSEAAPYLIGGAAMGVVSWAGLGFAAEQRRRAVARRMLRDASHRIARRLDEHVPRRATVRPAGLTRSREASSHRQYMAVVSSGGRTYK